RAKSVSRHASGLHKFSRFLFDRRRANEHGRGAGGATMKQVALLFVAGFLLLLSAGCSTEKVTAKQDPADTAPPPAKVEADLDANNFKADHPEQFPLVTAGSRIATPELPVTGVVSPDVSRQVTVPSLATGRVIEINARLGDTV